MFGKLFGRGKPKRDAFGVETATTTVGVPSSSETTVVTTTSETRAFHPKDVLGFSPTGGMDLGGLMATVREAQAAAGGDREAMAKLLRERLGGDASVAIDQQSSVDWSLIPGQQDPIALLATLTELHEKGVVSDEQFEAQKRRLLGSS